jgi:hypothetical protein
MTHESEANERYREAIAILTVLIQIRDGNKARATEGDIAAAQNLYDKVKGEV